MGGCTHLDTSVQYKQYDLYDAAEVKVLLIFTACIIVSPVQYNQETASCIMQNKTFNSSTLLMTTMVVVVNGTYRGIPYQDNIPQIVARISTTFLPPYSPGKV